MKNTLSVSPLGNGSFPVVPVNSLVSLSLGNGSRFDVIVTPTGQGLCLFVLGHGAYCFHFAPSYAYLGGKLGLLDGDAICFVRFLAAQLDGPQEVAKSAAHVRTLNALKVLVFTERTYGHLAAHDPQALKQALGALTLGDIDTPQAEFLGRMRVAYPSSL